MNVLLAHAFRGTTGWLEGKLVHDRYSPRYDIVNKAGNKLVQGATAGFLATLKNKGLLKEDTAEKCEYCGDLWEDCACGAHCPDD